ncbi:MAG: tetratricopeptide repeat protein [Bacteroidales bacterium]|nr:tetratricopeptide repeat protein [Bacteroidales bacterium]
MKRINVLTVAVILFSVALIAGCGLKKMVKKYETVRYEATPNPLETHGGKIRVSITGTIPEKYFHKKAKVEFTPVLRYAGGEVRLKTITLKGEKAEGDGIVISKKTRSTFTYEDIIDYNPLMNTSELFVTATAILKDKRAVLGEVKVADGVIYTSERVGRGENIILAQHPYEEEILVTRKASIYFEQNLHALNMNLPYNKRPESIAALNELKEFTKNGWVIKDVQIKAWASPEGEETYNRDLSDNRSKTAQKYMNDHFAAVRTAWTRARKEYQANIPINVTAMGEDWEGFKAAVASSTIADRNAILNVVNAHTDVARREQEIRNMAVIYREIEVGILPALRRAEIVVTSYEPRKTKEQIAMLSTTQPDSLKFDEIMYAATLTEDLNTKLTVYKNATLVFPQEWKAYNNAGYIALKLNKLDEAATYLEKANSLSPNNGTVLNNLGVLAAWNKDYARAESLYNQAQANGTNVTYNFAPINIKKGLYSAALGNMSGKTCDYNLGLAQLLNGDKNAALATLECAPRNAQTYYLLAVVGARMNNSTVLYDNLRKAVQEDSSLKSVAKGDREFIRFTTNTEFENIVR